MFLFGKKQKKKDNLNNSSSTTATSSSSSSLLRQSTMTTRTSSTTPPTNKKSVTWDLELEKSMAASQRNDIPPFPDGERCDHGAATLPDGSVVVVGGFLNRSTATNTVWIWARQSMSWTAGPPLQEPRYGLALVVCGNQLYAIGGWNGSEALDTVECVDVSAVCGGTQGQEPRTGLSSQSWTTLPCRLSNARDACATVAVSDRHLVVMGGYNGEQYLDTVDLLDTQRNTVQLAPLRMTTARYRFGASLVGGTIYAVGGYDGSNNLNTVECCDIVVDRSSSRSSKGTWLSGNSNQELDTAAPWRVVPALRLSTGRGGFGLAAVGRSLIVAGGYDGKSGLKSVEVVDTQKGKVWQFPEMGSNRVCAAAVALRDGLVAVLGGYKLDSVETLLLFDPQTKLDVQQVFISHTGQDPAAASFAGFLSDKLEDRHGISAFLDSEKLETGDAWMHVIEENAKKCQVFVCLVSPSYFMRYWCLHELDLAMAAGRRIVPVYLEGNIPNAFAVSTRERLSGVFERKQGRADHVVVDRWCENLLRLDSIQGMRNYSTHKHSLARFCSQIAQTVKDNIPE